MTSTQITVAALLLEATGPIGNSAVGAPDPPQQQAWAQQVADYINAHGGAACRKLALRFYTANLADSNSLEQACQNVIQAKPFAVMDLGAYALSPLYTCYPNAHLPFIGCCDASFATVDQYKPYLLEPRGLLDNLYTNGVRAMQQAGSFDPAKGFKKLGVLYQDCHPDVVTKFFATLHQVGVSDAQMTSYDFGCPTLFASASDIQQALLKFQQAGVTLVTQMGFEANWSTFTKAAQQQGFKPTYAMGAVGIASVGGALGPDGNNADGTIAYVTDRYGEEDTPGATPSPGTQTCNAIFAAAGSPPVWKQGLGVGGFSCSELLLIQAAADNAPELTRTALAAGLMRVGSMQLSYPLPDGNFAGLSFPYGGEYYRAIQFHKACACWQVISPFSPLLVKP